MNVADLPSAVAAECRKRGITTRDLAAHLGVTYEGLRLHLRGHRESLRVDTAKRLAAFLGLHLVVTRHDPQQDTAAMLLDLAVEDMLSAAALAAIRAGVARRAALFWGCHDRALSDEDVLYAIRQEATRRLEGLHPGAAPVSGTARVA